MGCASNRNQHGFTLVEISIVMIIIGLLIGGTFGGMKLIENMQVNKTVQDLKAIESAALTFKDTYGRLPGDLVNPAARLPSCTVAPCATPGNGNRRIDSVVNWQDALTATDERYLFWHHLQGAGMLSMEYSNTLDMNFGEGQPNAPVGSGYRIIEGNFVAGTRPNAQVATIVGVSSSASIPYAAPAEAISCAQVGSIDSKIDDNVVYYGAVQGWGCGPPTPEGAYIVSGTGALWYDFKGF